MTNDFSSNQDHQQIARKDFMDYLSVLYLWKKFILINIAIFIVVIVAITFLIPNTYKSVASILPPKDLSAVSGGAASLFKGVSGIKIPGFGGQSSTYSYLAILKSRTANLEVVRKFGLVDVYKTRNRSEEIALKILSGNTLFDIQDDDNITIEVIDEDPLRASDMANYYVELLNKISYELGSQEARNNREFLEKRVTTTKEELFNAEEALKKYQVKSGMPMSVDPNSPEVKGIGELYVMKAKKDLELAILERTVGPDNPMLVQTKTELSEINKKVSKIPNAGMETLRLYREVFIQQQILQFIIPLYEQAKVDEQKTVPVILILDKAVPLEKKYRPQRSLIVFLGTSVFFLFVCVFTFMLHGFLLYGKRDSLLRIKLYEYAKNIQSFYKVQL